MITDDIRKPYEHIKIHNKIDKNKIHYIFDELQKKH